MSHLLKIPICNIFTSVDENSCESRDFVPFKNKLGVYGLVLVDLFLKINIQSQLIS